jgi:hypothetical protein
MFFIFVSCKQHDWPGCWTAALQRTVGGDLEGRSACTNIRVGLQGRVAWTPHRPFNRANRGQTMQPGTQEQSATEVLAADARRIDALVAADLATLDELTAEDYTHVETNGGLRSKAQFLALVGQPDLRFVSWTIDENHVRIFGDVAIVSGRYRNVVRTAAGVQPEKHARHLRVWVRRDGAWRNVAHQATRLD